MKKRVCIMVGGKKVLLGWVKENGRGQFIGETVQGEARTYPYKDMARKFVLREARF